MFIVSAGYDVQHQTLNRKHFISLMHKKNSYKYIENKRLFILKRFHLLLVSYLL